MKEYDRKGYPWLFFDVGRPWLTVITITLFIIALSLGIFFVYTRVSNDPSPDSIGGYAYAIAGSIFMLMATFMYSRVRRSHNRRVGELNGALQWHISFGSIALILLFLHSFGNFNLRTGTYALWGMIALVLSGAIGRFIDRMAPRAIAQQARKALTDQGEDRIESISRRVQAIVKHNVQGVRGFKAENRREAAIVEANNRANMRTGTASLPESWDLAYLTLAETPQEASRNAQQYRFVPDSKSPLAQPGALIPGYHEQIEDLHDAQKALQQEKFFRALIRYWRVFHVLLVILTIGLTLWHLEYAATLLIPLIGHH
jgi:hypothetical protein